MNKKHPGLPVSYHKDADRQLRAIAEQIREQREALGLTQESLAEYLNISVEMVKHIEQQRGWPSVQLLFYMCRKMKIKILVG